MKTEETPMPSWDKTASRFVAFFDILGFKEMVMKGSHEHTLTKLQDLKLKVNAFDVFAELDFLKDLKIDFDQTRSVTFSDSFIFFSKGNLLKDAVKIIIDSYAIGMFAHQAQIPIKGAISYGKITVDFENSLFFGQPIIDSYLLHDELHLLTTILDHNAENRLKELDHHEIFDEVITIFKADMKSSKINHKLIRPFADSIKETTETIRALYVTTSGKPRIYIDNTIEFYNKLQNK